MRIIVAESEKFVRFLDTSFRFHQCILVVTSRKAILVTTLARRSRIGCMPQKKKLTGDSVRVFSMPKPKKKIIRTMATPKSFVEAERKREWHIGMQLLIAGSTMTVLMVLGLFDRATFATLRSKASGHFPATIGIEHQNPLKLLVVIARKNSSGYASIVNGSDDQIHISVPSGWKRMEVSGAPLSSFTQDIPVFGFSRWTLPPHAGIKMLTDSVPDALFFDSSSQSTTEIDLQTIDLIDLSSTSHVLLLKDHALARLWGSNE